ncbi:MAG: hypothetical protein JWO36_4623 [Myxococcales bacterium]|nr:hypothetical protein [Myxococcales bacterium]
MPGPARQTQIGERRERLQRTELKIKGLIDFIATGDKSEYVVSTMRDLEAYARTEKAEIAELIEESRVPIALPSIDDLSALSQDARQLMNTDHERGRDMLRQYLEDGVIKCTVDEEGPYASCDLGAHILLSDFGARNRRIPGSGSSSRDSQVFASSSGGRI